MNKKNLYTIIGIFIALFILGLMIYPIFYNSDKNENLNTNVVDNSQTSLKKIDVLSNLSFFKILVEDTTSTDGPKFSEKFVTIRDEEIVKELHEILSTAELYESDDARGYDTPTTAICYLDDDTMYSFFVAEPDLIVFSDNDYNKIMYKLDPEYNIEEFLTKLYNTNVNSYNYSTFSKNGKYGVKYSNKVIINPEYDSIELINPKIDVFAVTLDNVTTFVDKYGENPFPNFTNIELISGTGGGESLWYENALRFESENKFGLASLDGSILLPAEYDKIEALNYVKDYLIVSQNGKEKVIKLLSSGYEELTGEFDSIKILGADLDYTSKESQYLTSNSTVIVGINNGIREQYFEIEEQK